MNAVGKMHARDGFTLAEVMVASMVMSIAIAMCMGAFVYILRSTRSNQIQEELDIQVQISMERLKEDMRLSAIDKMFLYSADMSATNRTFDAISFPMARDDDGDGLIEVDSTNKIIWDKQVVYHVWTSMPNQLRMTVFDPRGTLTDSERQAQLSSVVLWGNGSQTHGSANATTENIFENLMDWTLEESKGTYDAYASTTQREAGVSFGSLVLSNGTRTVKFTATNKNSQSSSYKIGIDTIYMTPSYSPREGEAQLPVAAQMGAVADYEYMPGGSWSGNYQLKFPATASNQYVTLNIYNDKWEETNFRMTGETHSDTTVAFDETLTPMDYVVRLGDTGVAWEASAQTYDTIGGNSTNDEVKNTAIRVLMRGSEMQNGGFLTKSAGRVRVKIKASTAGSLMIENVFIAQCISNDVPMMDGLAAGSKMTFLGGDDKTLAAGESVYTDFLPGFRIAQTNSYLVTLLIKNIAANGNAYKWTDNTQTNVSQAWIIPESSDPGNGDADDAVWSSRGDVIATNVIFGVEALDVLYPTNGVYTSGIFDTVQSAPAYNQISWDYIAGGGSTLKMKVRTADNSDMSDASDWSSFSWMSSSPQSMAAIGNKRYVQFQCNMTPGSTFTVTPVLKRVVVDWPGISQVVDIQATMTKGPEYGVVLCEVDGQPLRRGISAKLTIYKEAPIFHGATNTMTSSLKCEIQPRNTGK